MILNCLKGRKIGMFGLGITGLGSYETLKRSADLTVCWADSEKDRKEFADKFGPEDIKDLRDPIWKSLDEISVSPGVPPSNEIFSFAGENNIKITSDIDLLFRENKDSFFIGVTGTNGKSTTAELAGFILKSSGLDSVVCGNNGICCLSLSPGKRKIYVIEISSFQLDIISELRLDAAALTNVTPDHLDRYGSIEPYARSKEKIISLLRGGGKIFICEDDPVAYGISLKNEKKSIGVSALKNKGKGIFVSDGEIFFGAGSVKYSSPSLKGTHNKQNIGCAYGLCLEAGPSPWEISKYIGLFKSLPHRMEYAGSFGDINFYDDSKATNTDSAAKSIEALAPVYWIAGGILKEENLDILKNLAPKIGKAYFFGRDGALLAEAFKGILDFELKKDLKECLDSAFADAFADRRAGVKNILLAPACASYDQFENFMHRGRVFKEIVSAKISEANL